MTKDTIVQFVCFITNITPDEFISGWERFAQKFNTKKSEPLLLQPVEDKKNKFRYISQHEWKSEDFLFTFMNEKKADHFPEMPVRVVQAGGYIPLQYGKKMAVANTTSRLLAFISHDEYDIDFYRQLPLFTHLNIYQAFFESCLYGHVMEFFVPDSDANELLLQLKQRHGVEAGLYKESMVHHL